MSSNFDFYLLIKKINFRSQYPGLSSKVEKDNSIDFDFYLLYKKANFRLQRPECDHMFLTLNFINVFV